MRLDQFMWSKGKLRLYASKTENQRDLPLWIASETLPSAESMKGSPTASYYFHAQQP